MRLTHLAISCIFFAANEGNGREVLGDASIENNNDDGDDIPTFHTNSQSQASDFANYFSSYAELHHQKMMLSDHNRMAAYHSAIMGNADIFKDKVVMDVGTGSGILATWAAMAGAKRVYAIEYTDMAKHATNVVKANGVDHIVKVVQTAVEDFELPDEDWEEFGFSSEDGDDPDSDANDNCQSKDSNATEGVGECTPQNKKNKKVVDIIISEWMGYLLLRESMLDSVIRARDTFLKPKSGILLPSHATIFLAPVNDEEGRKVQQNDYSDGMADWHEFTETTKEMYGVDMTCLDEEFEKEQRDYYLLSSLWTQLGPDALLAEPSVVKTLDMAVCTLEDARGVGMSKQSGDGNIVGAPFEFDIPGLGSAEEGTGFPISGFAGYFTVDFKSRTDAIGMEFAPKVENPAFLSTGPEYGHTHWGQLVFYLPSPMHILADQTTWINGTMEMIRSKKNARLYNVRLNYMTSRRKTGNDKDSVLMKGGPVKLVYQVP